MGRRYIQGEYVGMECIFIATNDSEPLGGFCFGTYILAIASYYTCTLCEMQSRAFCRSSVHEEEE